MTGLKMNASAMKNAARAAVMGGLLLSGACAAPFQAAMDPQAPLSDRIQHLVDVNRAYPRWADFPAAPTDVPAPPMRVLFGAAAAAVVGRQKLAKRTKRKLNR